MTDLLHHLSSLSPDQLAAAAWQYGAGLVVALALLWKTSRAAGRGAARLFRKAPPSPLCAAILEALDAPDARTPFTDVLEAGGVRVISAGLTFDADPAPKAVQTGDDAENVKHTLTPREQKRIGRKAHTVYRRVKAREDAERAAAALVRIPAPYWPRG